MFSGDEATATCITDRQPETLPDHLVSLPGWETKWGLWKWVVLRGAGFAVDGVLALASSEGTRAADELLAAEAEAEQAWECALDAVNAALDAQPWRVDGYRKDERALLLIKASRLLKKGKQPPLLDECTTVGQTIRELQQASVRVDDAYSEFVRCFEVVQESENQALRAAAQDKRFLEAVTWQNRRAFGRGIDAMLCDPSPSWRRKKENLVASYLQRYCTKNDSIGFFGPIGWARISTGAHNFSVRPGQSLLSSREVYFECWTIDALCERLSQDATLRPWMRPRRLPSVRLFDSMLHLPFKPPVQLTSEQALVLSACNGETTAREIALRLLATPAGTLYSEQQVYGQLELLEAQNLIVWQVEVEDETHPEQRLRELLEGVEDETARARALELLDQIEQAKAKIARSAGDAEQLASALEQLDVLFERETGKEATRKGGQMYAGRTLVYEDCRRDVEVEIGTEVLEGLSEPLGLLLESARWMAWKIGEEYRGALHEIYLSLVRKSGSTVVDIEPLWLQAEPLLIGSERRLLDKVRGAFQQKWSEVVSLNPDARSVQYSSAELRGRVAVTFAAPRTEWSAARYHSPDVMIAAESVDAIRRGQYCFVLGELHVATNTMSAAPLVSQHPSPEDLFQAIAVDLPRPRVVPVLPKNAPVPRRAAPVLCSPEDFLLAFGDGAPGIPPARLLPTSALVVEASGPDLFVRTRDHQHRFDIIEFFGSVLAGTIIDQFKLFERMDHTPRVSIDRLVVQRESWSIPAAEMAFAFERHESDRFLEARRFQQQYQMPRQVFCKVPVEMKPVYLDFNSATYVRLLAKLIRRSVEEDGEGARVTVTEMLPGIEEVWLPDSEGNHYTSEFRFVALDLFAA